MFLVQFPETNTTFGQHNKQILIRIVAGIDNNVSLFLAVGGGHGNYGCNAQCPFENLFSSGVLS